MLSIDYRRCKIIPPCFRCLLHVFFIGEQDNAEAAVRQMLVDFSLQMGLGQVGGWVGGSVGR